DVVGAIAIASREVAPSIERMRADADLQSHRFELIFRELDAVGFERGGSGGDEADGLSFDETLWFDDPASVGLFRCGADGRSDCGGGGELREVTTIPHHAILR